MKLDRYLGCLLGLACGDAVGTTLEFEQPGTFAPITDMIGGGPFGLKAGEWTDDTSMALCLATSLVEKCGFDPLDQVTRYVRWWQNGYLSSTGQCFDIGVTTRTALSKFVETGNTSPGSTDERSAGNGSIMRLAPVPMFYAENCYEAIENAAASSYTTHGATLCVEACRYFGYLIVNALNGASKQTLLATPSPDLAINEYFNQKPLISAIAEIAAGSYKTKAPPEIRGTGYVVQSLEAALWAFHNSETFEEGCLLAVNLGEDADTTGAVYGQLAGAFYGVKGVPTRWLQRLKQRTIIEDLAKRLYERRVTNQIKFK